MKLQIYTCLLDIVFKFEGECGMNILMVIIRETTRKIGQPWEVSRYNLLINELAMYLI